MRVCFVQCPEGLSVDSQQWSQLREAIAGQQPDVLLTNEMPFGPWLAASSDYQQVRADVSMAAHSLGIAALKALQLPLVLSSQPVATANRLANEAYALVEGEYHAVHHKHYFPQESGFYERSWFETAQPGFELLQTPSLNVGFLLCTELMFNEWARHYGRSGAHLIAVPRASGQSYAHWKTAAAMAAIVSGCYVVSANRAGNGVDGQEFGGCGFAYAPGGHLICESSRENPVCSFELALQDVALAQREYPCYVAEL
ncbi:MAG: carbon-nitrogen hydrolase family protein [Pseudomonadales bacterium]